MVELSEKNIRGQEIQSSKGNQLKWQLITLERLFSNFFGKSLYQSIYQMDGAEQRAEFLVEQVKRMTGLTEFGAYLCKLLTIDALFLNEDRHTHNIAVLLDPDGKYHYCPIFDNGAALLSDTSSGLCGGGTGSRLDSSGSGKNTVPGF